jgi:hypothetical protein
MSKRILSIRTLQIVDESPDTSYLGEYSDTRESQWSIDRKHSPDCQSLNPTNDETVERLERALNSLFAFRCKASESGDDEQWQAISDAEDILIQAQDDVTACDCDESGDWTRNEYRYFNPSQNYSDCTPDEIRTYIAQDYQRMERLNAGDWSYIGIRAEAEVTVDDTVQTVSSGGLWGIESDSDSQYIASVASDELASLRDILHELGFSKRAIATACKDLVEVGA